MSHRHRQGFALPMTLFLISILTLMLTAAFTKVQSDRRVGNSSGAAVDALGIAKAGVQQYMGTRPINTPGSTSAPWRPPDGDSVRITIGSGYADVIAKVVRRPADTVANWMYVIRGVGHVIDPTQGADPQAVRTIAQFAQWQTGKMDIQAAYTAANRVRVVVGASNTIYIYGLDACGVTAGLPALKVANGSDDIWNGAPGTYWNNNYWYDYGTTIQVEGDTQANIALNTNIDWSAILGGGITPDYTSIQVSGADQWNYTTQMVTGNATLSGAGSGLLIVTGDFTISGSTSYWYGVVLVGGRVIFNATSWSWVNGALISGLNDGPTGGSAVSRTDIGNRPTYLYYNSCMVSTALARLTGFAPITNGWVDNWSVY